MNRADTIMGEQKKKETNSPQVILKYLGTLGWEVMGDDPREML